MPKIIRSKTTKNNMPPHTPEEPISTGRYESQEICVPRHRCHIHWAIFFLISLIALGAVIYVGRPDLTTLKASDTMITSPADSAQSSTPKLKNVLGTVTDVGTDNISITSVGSPDTAGDAGAALTILFNDETQFVYHPLTSKADSNKKIFGTKKGSFDGIKVGMYLSVATFDDVTSGASLNATEIGYSEQNPRAMDVPTTEATQPTEETAPPATPPAEEPVQPTTPTEQPVQ